MLTPPRSVCSMAVAISRFSITVNEARCVPISDGLVEPCTSSKSCRPRGASGAASLRSAASRVTLRRTSPSRTDTGARRISLGTLGKARSISRLTSSSSSAVRERSTVKLRMPPPSESPSSKSTLSVMSRRNFTMLISGTPLFLAMRGTSEM